LNAVVYGFDEENTKLLKQAFIRCAQKCSLCAHCTDVEEEPPEQTEVVFADTSEFPHERVKLKKENTAVEVIDLDSSESQTENLLNDEKKQ